MNKYISFNLTLFFALNFLAVYSPSDILALSLSSPFASGDQAALASENSEELALTDVKQPHSWPAYQRLQEILDEIKTNGWTLKDFEEVKKELRNCDGMQIIEDVLSRNRSFNENNLFECINILVGKEEFNKIDLLYKKLYEAINKGRSHDQDREKSPTVYARNKFILDILILNHTIRKSKLNGLGQEDKEKALEKNIEDRIQQAKKGLLFHREIEYHKGTLLDDEDYEDKENANIKFFQKNIKELEESLMSLKRRSQDLKVIDPLEMSMQLTLDVDIQTGGSFFEQTSQMKLPLSFREEILGLKDFTNSPFRKNAELLRSVHKYSELSQEASQQVSQSVCQKFFSFLNQLEMDIARGVNIPFCQKNSQGQGLLLGDKENFQHFSQVVFQYFEKIDPNDNSYPKDMINIILEVINVFIDHSQYKSKEGVLYTKINVIKEAFRLLMSPAYFLDAPTGIGKTKTILPIVTVLTALLPGKMAKTSIGLFSDEEKLRSAIADMTKKSGSFMDKVNKSDTLSRLVKRKKGKIIRFVSLEVDNVAGPGKIRKPATLIEDGYKNGGLVIYSTVEALQSVFIGAQYGKLPAYAPPNYVYWRKKMSMITTALFKKSKVIVDEAHLLAKVMDIGFPVDAIPSLFPPSFPKAPKKAAQLSAKFLVALETPILKGLASKENSRFEMGDHLFLIGEDNEKIKIEVFADANDDYSKRIYFRDDGTYTFEQEAGELDAIYIDPLKGPLQHQLALYPGKKYFSKKDYTSALKYGEIALHLRQIIMGEFYQNVLDVDSEKKFSLKFWRSPVVKEALRSIGLGRLTHPKALDTWFMDEKVTPRKNFLEKSFSKIKNFILEKLFGRSTYQMEKKSLIELAEFLSSKAISISEVEKSLSSGHRTAESTRDVYQDAIVEKIFKTRAGQDLATELAMRASELEYISDSEEILMHKSLLERSIIDLIKLIIKNNPNTYESLKQYMDEEVKILKIRKMYGKETYQPKGYRLSFDPEEEGSEQYAKAFLNKRKALEGISDELGEEPNISFYKNIIQECIDVIYTERFDLLAPEGRFLISNAKSTLDIIYREGGTISYMSGTPAPFLKEARLLWGAESNSGLGMLIKIFGNNVETVLYFLKEMGPKLYGNKGEELYEELLSFYCEEYHLNLKEKVTKTLSEQANITAKERYKRTLLLDKSWKEGQKMPFEYWAVEFKEYLKAKRMQTTLDFFNSITPPLETLETSNMKEEDLLSLSKIEEMANNIEKLCQSKTNRSKAALRMAFNDMHELLFSKGDTEGLESKKNQTIKYLMHEIEGCLGMRSDSLVYNELELSQFLQSLLSVNVMIFPGSGSRGLYDKNDIASQLKFFKESTLETLKSFDIGSDLFGDVALEIKYEDALQVPNNSVDKKAKEKTQDKFSEGVTLVFTGNDGSRIPVQIIGVKVGENGLKKLVESIFRYIELLNIEENSNEGEGLSEDERAECFSLKNFLEEHIQSPGLDIEGFFKQIKYSRITVTTTPKLSVGWDLEALEPLPATYFNNLGSRASLDFGFSEFSQAYGRDRKFTQLNHLRMAIFRSERSTFGVNDYSLKILARDMIRKESTLSENGSKDAIKGMIEWYPRNYFLRLMRKAQELKFTEAEYRGVKDIFGDLVERFTDRSDKQANEADSLSKSYAIAISDLRFIHKKLIQLKDHRFEETLSLLQKEIELSQQIELTGRNKEKDKQKRLKINGGIYSGSGSLSEMGLLINEMVDIEDLSNVGSGTFEDEDSDEEDLYIPKSTYSKKEKNHLKRNYCKLVTSTGLVDKERFLKKVSRKKLVDLNLAFLREMDLTYFDAAQGSQRQSPSAVIDSEENVQDQEEAAVASEENPPSLDRVDKSKAFHLLLESLDNVKEPSAKEAINVFMGGITRMGFDNLTIRKLIRDIFLESIEDQKKNAYIESFEKISNYELALFFIYTLKINNIYLNILEIYVLRFFVKKSLEGDVNVEEKERALLSLIDIRLTRDSDITFLDNLSLLFLSKDGNLLIDVSEMKKVPKLFSKIKVSEWLDIYHGEHQKKWRFQDFVEDILKKYGSKESKELVEAIEEEKRLSNSEEVTIDIIRKVVFERIIGYEQRKKYLDTFVRIYSSPNMGDTCWGLLNCLQERSRSGNKMDSLYVVSKKINDHFRRGFTLSDLSMSYGAEIFDIEKLSSEWDKRSLNNPAWIRDLKPKLFNSEKKPVDLEEIKNFLITRLMADYSNVESSIPNIKQDIRDYLEELRQEGLVLNEEEKKQIVESLVATFSTDQTEKNDEILSDIPSTLRDNISLFSSDSSTTVLLKKSFFTTPLKDYFDNDYSEAVKSFLLLLEKNDSLIIEHSSDFREKVYTEERLLELILEWGLSKKDKIEESDERNELALIVNKGIIKAHEVLKKEGRTKYFEKGLSVTPDASFEPFFKDSRNSAFLSKSLRVINGKVTRVKCFDLSLLMSGSNANNQPFISELMNSLFETEVISEEMLDRENNVILLESNFEYIYVILNILKTISSYEINDNTESLERILKNLKVEFNLFSEFIRDDVSKKEWEALITGMPTDIKSFQNEFNLERLTGLTYKFLFAKKYEGDNDVSDLTNKSDDLFLEMYQEKLQRWSEQYRLNCRISDDLEEDEEYRLEIDENDQLTLSFRKDILLKAKTDIYELFYLNIEYFKKYRDKMRSADNLQDLSPFFERGDQLSKIQEGTDEDLLDRYLQGVIFESQVLFAENRSQWIIDREKELEGDQSMSKILLFKELFMYAEILKEDIEKNKSKIIEVSSSREKENKLLEIFEKLESLDETFVQELKRYMENDPITSSDGFDLFFARLIDPEASLLDSLVREFYRDRNCDTRRLINLFRKAFESYRQKNRDELILKFNDRRTSLIVDESDLQYTDYDEDARKSFISDKLSMMDAIILASKSS
ncbi:hypothetical protein AB834_03430 [PVC group bacterium (ex Bugula neritina AB1)]|nr:hypothetical protein AB834_03430 [PVC group bacterium (ex Bugula neritina AB1)]